MISSIFFDGHANLSQRKSREKVPRGTDLPPPPPHPPDAFPLSLQNLQQAPGETFARKHSKNNHTKKTHAYVAPSIASLDQMKKENLLLNSSVKSTPPKTILALGKDREVYTFPEKRFLRNGS